jgi:hypothetical protein
MKGQSETERVGKNTKGINLIDVQRDYILRMIDEVPGRKVLIVDDKAMKLTSMMISQSELLQKEVYLVERLEEMSKEKDFGTLKTLILMAPIPQNINLLAEELGSYSITTCYLCKKKITGRFHFSCRRSVSRTTSYERHRRKDSVCERNKL